MKNKKKKVSAALGIATAACVAVSSLALFTDHFQSQAKVTAGTLDLTLTESWKADNAALEDIYKPGTALTLDYTLVNDGNRAASVRENFVITADKSLSTGDSREFDLYEADDVVLYAEGNVLDITGDPLEPTYGSFTKGSEKHFTLSYALDELVLNGSGAHGETVSGGLSERNGDYCLVFNYDVDNEYQNVDLDIEYMAQALQESNTGEDTWADAHVITEKVSFGGQNTNVVPTVEEGGGK